MADLTFTDVANGDTFSSWLTNHNDICEFIRVNAVSADNTSGGAITLGNTYINGYFSAEYISVGSELRGGNNAATSTLYITSDADIANTLNVQNLSTLDSVDVTNTLLVNGISTLNDTFPAADCVDSLGNTSSQWNAVLCDLQIGDTGSVLPLTDAIVDIGQNGLRFNIRAADLIADANVYLGSVANTVTVAGDLDVVNQITADSLNTNKVDFNGNAIATSNTAAVTATANTTIDQFSTSETKAAKLLISVTTANAADSYLVEMLVLHNGSEVSYTRYGELVLGATSTIDINAYLSGGNVVITADTPNASGPNPHTFKILRTQTSL